MVRSTLLFACLALTGCSLLAPSDDELLGGTTDAGAGAAGAGGTGGGNVGGAGTGGSSGAPTGGTSSGGTSSGGTSSGGTSSGGTSSGGTSSGGTSSGGTSSGGTSSGGTSSGGTGGTTCVPKSGDATALPRAMYLLLDRSASMLDQNKFSYAVQAINTFAGGSPAAGIDFGMQYFGLEVGGSCAGGGYSTPAVGFGSLPGLSTQVANSLAAATPNGSTPFEGAVNGGKIAATGYLASKPATQVDVVFITDITTLGAVCSASASAIASIVASTWPAVATHFIGLPGTNTNTLNSFAAAGGTVSAELASTPLAITAALSRAVTPCRFSLPSGADPAKLSLDLVTGNSPSPLTKRASSSACGDNQGWFDHAGGMALCPASCRDLANASAAKIRYTTTCP